MEMRTSKSVTILWPLILGLGLTLALMWALTPSPAVEAQPINPGYTVDLTYERVWGLVNPGDVVTVTRTAGGAAYGAAEADGVGFFWTPLYDGSGQPVDIVAADTIDIYVNGALDATITPLAISGGIDVLANQVVGTVNGAGAGVPVTVTVFLWGSTPGPGAPQESTTTGAGGSFTVNFGNIDLGAENLVAVDYAASGNTVRGYLYPDPPIFLVQDFERIAGYAPNIQTITATVYMTYPTDPRWEGTGFAGFPHGFYNLGGVDVAPGDVVELDLGGGTLISTTVFDVGNLSFDTGLEQVHGIAPSGEIVQVSMWQKQNDALVYTETFAVAVPGDLFTATFASADLRPRDFVDVILTDADGNQTQLLSGPPYLEVLLDPTSEWDCAWGRVDAPYQSVTLTLQTATDVYTRENPMWDSNAGNLVGSPWGGCFAVRGPDWGPIDFSPGDTVTLQSATWAGSVVIPDLSWEADTANEQITGQAPSGELQVTVLQWNDDRYPINGSATRMTTAAPSYAADFTGFDVRDGNSLQVQYFDPVSDFATQINTELRYFEVNPPWGVWAPQFSDSDVLTATLYESDGVTVKRETFEDNDDNPDGYWLEMEGEIAPGDWVTVTDGAGWTASLQVPTLTARANEDTDMIWGEGPKALLYVDGGRDDSGFGSFVPCDDYVLDTAFFDHDLQWGDGIGATYQAPSGNRVREQYRWPQIIAHFDMEGWNNVWGWDAIPGDTILITVTHPVDGVVASGETTAGACDWCAPNDYNLDLPDNTVVPGNDITVDFGDGFVEGMTVLDISAEANADTDVVTVTAPVSTPVHMHANHDLIGWWGSDTQVVGTSGHFVFDLGADGYDIIPGTNFDVYGHQYHDHNTHYSFHIPAPNLRVGKWNRGNYARPGGVQVYSIYYTNEGDGVAENALIVDTLPSSLTYADDTSGIMPDIGAGGVITWQLGDLAPGEEGAFMVTLDVPGTMPTGSGVIAPNCAHIDTTTQWEWDWGNNEQCSDPVDVWEDDVEISVDKWVHPDDPTPGQELIYTIEWCNNRGAAAGPVWLTDTLPLGTTLVDWHPEIWWQRYWTEVSASANRLVLYAPGLPGDNCERLELTLGLATNTDISTTLENTVVIATADDVYLRNNERVHTDAHVGEPRYDMRLEKSLDAGLLVPGGWVNYFIYYSNEGNAAAHILLEDTLPSGLSYEYAYWGGGQPGENEPLPDPAIIGNKLTWDLGTVPVGGERWFHLQASIDGAVSPGTTIDNCATIGIFGQADSTPEDNTRCHSVTVNDYGPNLRVHKQHTWDGDWQLDYEIRFDNIGDEIINDVWITDYLPAGTTWNGWWEMDFDWERLVTNTESGDVLGWNFSELYPGDSGWLRFEADLDEPGVLEQWYTNTVEISTPPGDVTSDDNYDDDKAFSGPAQLFVWIEDPAGNRVAAFAWVWNDWGYGRASESAPDRPGMFGDLEIGETYWVQAWPFHTDRPDWVFSEKQKVTIRQDPIELTLRMRSPNITGVIHTPEGKLLPTVYDGEGNPLAPAAVNVHNSDWSIDLNVGTNPTGTFGVTLPDGKYVLRGYPRQELVLTYTKSLRRDIAASGMTQNLGEVRLTYPRVWGTVVTPEGDRVSTWISLWNEEGTYWDGDDTFGPPDYEEPFRLGGMPAGHYYVQAEPPWTNPEGYGFSNIYEFDVAPDSWYDPKSTEQITLVLQMANFVGDLHYPLDSNCPDCPVQWANARLHDLDWNVEHWATTGEDGRFAFSGLGAGEYIVDVFLPGDLALAWDPPPPYTFTLASPDDQVKETLYLQPAVLNKHVVGEVVYEDGSPVGDADGDGKGDAWIYAYHEDSGAWTGDSNDPDGSYSLDLKGGLWKLGVEPMHPDVDWYFDPERPVGGEQWVWFPLDSTLELTKTRIFTVTRFAEGDFFHVTGVVTTPNAAPVPPGVWVELCNEEGKCFGAMVEASGRFSVPVLPGAYRVWIEVDSETGLLPPLDNGFPIKVNDDLDLGVLQLLDPAGRTASVSGRVIITGTGQGLGNVAIYASTKEGDWASTETISTGNYVVDLFPGHWYAYPVLSSIQQDDYVILPPAYQEGYLADGDPPATDINFYLHYRDATIKGQVVDEAGAIITDPSLSAVVFAEQCPLDPNLPCWVVDDDEVQGGTFELRVVGDVTYTLGIWLQTPGYMPGPPKDVYVKHFTTKEKVQLTLIEAGTKIHGYLLDGDLNPVQIEASVYGSDSEGKYWVEDSLWPNKDPYKYDLYVPTPETKPVTWTLRLGVDPGTGYIADPAHPNYKAVVNPGVETVPQIMYVQKLDTVISGTVTVGTLTGDPAPYVLVFAKGVAGTDSEGLYFEAETDKNGEFSMFVLPGKYRVSAYLPPELVGTHFPPLPKGWDSSDDKPVQLAFRPIPTGVDAIQICGALDVVPAEALAGDTLIPVLGWAEDGSTSEVTGTLESGYCMDVIANTTWYVWAAYEDTANDAYYDSLEKRVDVRDASVDGVDLTLQKAFDLPDPICVTFDPSKNKRISLPAPPELFEPLIDIPAGAMPVTGDVEVCATPRRAVPKGPRLLGFAYELEARDKKGNRITKKFKNYVRLTFYFSEAMVGDATEKDIQPVFYSAARNEWVALVNPFVDLEDFFATGKTNHFTMFGALSTPVEEHKIYLPLILR